MVVTIACAAAGCRSGSKAPTVLKTEDFIADPATMPTTLPATSPQSVASAGTRTAAPRAKVSVPEAREGVKEISVETSAPSKPGQFPAAIPTEMTTLVDAKIGEINGRPIRVGEMFDAVGDRLSATARTRRFSVSDWMQAGINPGANPDRDVTERDWRIFAGALFARQLNLMLQDEVLTAEARAALKPAQKQGIAYFIREQTENERRRQGGSRAELERSLREKNQNEQRFAKTIETRVLIEVQIEEKFRSRLKTSWKDVRLYYELNPQIYRPPLKARFRQIQVSADKAEAVEKVKSELSAGKPFEQVAALAENEYDRAHGGLAPDREFKGEYSQGEFFASPAWNAAARQLKPAEFTREPIEGTDSIGKKTVNWLYLESIIDSSRSLSDPEVQLSIARRLDQEALDAAINGYISKLKERASFTDIETMASLLVEIAAQRYWASGS